jgi:site-specific DNA recombinase
MTTHTEPVRTAVYLRISRDPNDRRTGVARQAKDCQAIAADLGWSVVETFDENNTSATRGTRPEYQRLVAAIRSGRITAVVFWEQDRYSRSVRETEDLLDMAQKFGVRAASSSGGEIDLTSPTGR